MDIVSTFTVRVEDGFGGISTALVTVIYLPDGPYIFYQGSSLAETLTLNLESTATTSISFMAKGGGAAASLSWSFENPTTNVNVTFDGENYTGRTVEIEVELVDGLSRGEFDVVVSNVSDVSDRVRVIVIGASSPPVGDVSRFRIRAFLGGAVR